LRRGRRPGREVVGAIVGVRALIGAAREGEAERERDGGDRPGIQLVHRTPHAAKRFARRSEARALAMRSTRADSPPVAGNGVVASNRSVVERAAMRAWRSAAAVAAGAGAWATDAGDGALLCPRRP